MKQKVLALGLSVGAFALIGCGGSNGEIPLETPTATISEQNTTALLSSLADTLNMPSLNNLLNNGALDGTQGMRTTPSPAGDGWEFPEAGEEQCEVSGTKKLTYTKGSQSDESKSTGDVAVAKVYESCKDSQKERNGKSTKGLTWTFTDTTRDYTKTKTVTNYKTTYEDGDIHNTEQYSEKTTDYEDRAKETGKGSTEYTFTGNGKYNGLTWTVKNKKFSSSYSYTKDNKTQTRSVRLSMKKEAYGGWLTMETTTPFKETIIESVQGNMYTTTYECEAGEAKIAAANHNITVSCVDKNYVVKFDGEKVN